MPPVKKQIAGKQIAKEQIATRQTADTFLE
jgi:hypothetical protein